MVWLARLWGEDGRFNCVEKYSEPMGGLKFLLQCLYNVEYLSFIPTFYKEMLAYAGEVLYIPNSKYTIWNNMYIKAAGKRIFYRDWFNKGIIFIQN